MKVRVVGSGNIWTSYNSASYLIDDSIIIDFPNGMCKYLFKQGINPRNIDNIVLTHFHGDHYFDIPFYLLMKSHAEDKKVNIYCDKEGKRKNKKLLKLAFPNSAKNVLVEADITYNFSDNFTINDYNVSRILVDHGRMKPAYGYIFTKDNISFGFTGDTTTCKSVEYMASICKYLFIECMYINGTSKHMGVDMLKVLIEKYPNCIFVVSHMEDETREELKKLNLKNVIVPEDGLVIDID